MWPNRSRRVGMRWLIGLVVVAAVAAAGWWYYVADGAVPTQANYKTDVAGWRALIAEDTAQLPTEIRVEIVGKDSVPLAAMQAGAPFDEYPRVRAAFQVNAPSGS